MYGSDEAHLYDLEHAVVNDIDYWTGIAQEFVPAGGHILELGCGTMRVGAPIAKLGFSYVGVDNSTEMLEVARSKVKTELAHLNQGIELIESDMRSFDLGMKVDLVIIPQSALLFLLTTQDQLSVLVNVSRHLNPGGVLAIDIFVPGPGMFSMIEEGRWWPERDLEQAGKKWMREVRHSLNFVSQTITMKHRTREYDQDGHFVKEWLSQHEVSFMFPKEFKLLLQAAEFEPLHFFDSYERTQFTSSSFTDKLLAIARKRS